MAKAPAAKNSEVIHQVECRVCSMGYQDAGVTLFFKGTELALKDRSAARVEAGVGLVKE